MHRFVKTTLFLAAAVLPQSCGLGTHYFLDAKQLEQFEAAGPIIPEVDTEKILSGLVKPGQYHVVAGDLLEIKGPKTVFLDPSDPGTHSTEAGAVHPGVHLTRVDTKGQITFPMVGHLAVEGKSLAEIEEMVAGAVYPKFLQRLPSIVAQVADYRTERVTVIGAVEKPGIVHLKSDELSLFSALQASGGIIKPGQLVLGAKLIRIRRPGNKRPKAMLLPVKGLSVPVGDVELKGGETIEVERYEPDTFTVVGLVQRANVYPRPPGVKFSLIDALATAGGTDLAANPPYATVFRRSADGKILPATFEITGPNIVQALQLSIKPGDVVVVAHTAASWTRAVISQAVRLQFGYVANQVVYQ